MGRRQVQVGFTLQRWGCSEQCDQGAIRHGSRVPDKPNPTAPPGALTAKVPARLDREGVMCSPANAM